MPDMRMRRLSWRPIPLSVSLGPAGQFVVDFTYSFFTHQLTKASGNMGKNMGKLSVAMALIAGSLLIGTSASAVGVYAGAPTERAAFQADAGPGLTLESFESPLVDAPSVDFPVSGPRGVTISVSTGLIGWSTFPRLVSDGTMGITFPETAITVTFDFAEATTAFGISVLDMNFFNLSYSDDAGNAIADVLLGDNCTAAGGPSCESRQFFGIVSATPFTQATFEYQQFVSGSGTLALDQMEYNSAAPIPLPVPALALLGGLGMLGAMARRRRVCSSR